MREQTQLKSACWALCPGRPAPAPLRTWPFSRRVCREALCPLRASAQRPEHGQIKKKSTHTNTNCFPSTWNASHSVHAPRLPRLTVTFACLAESRERGRGRLCCGEGRVRGGKGFGAGVHHGTFQRRAGARPVWLGGRPGAGAEGESVAGSDATTFIYLVFWPWCSQQVCAGL